MTKFLTTWRLNQTAMSPDIAEQGKAAEMWFAAIDKAMESGGLLEYGFFPDGVSGYTLFEGETKDAFRGATTYFPGIISDVREMIPYETGKEIIREMFKAQMEAMKR